MKTCLAVFLLLAAAFFFNACASTGAPAEIDSADASGISAQGAIGGIESAVSGPMYTGNGGRNLRLAVLAPDVQGLVPDYLPLYIQGLLNNNIGKFSAINLIDRQNLDKIISEQNLAAGGRFSDRDFVSIGNLVNAQYFLFGTIQKLSGDRYSLLLSITESNTGLLKANLIKNGTLAQLEGRGTLLNEATAELLDKLGVQLTAAGKRTLLAGNTSTVQAEAGLARGIKAQAGGAEVEALFNFAQAITFDPSQNEAAVRLNSLSTTISDGTISQRILNDIQMRDKWIEAFKETTRFFSDHPPFEIIFDSNLIQIGETDFVKRTVNLGMRIELNSSEAGFNVLNTLLEGLEKTGRRGGWGFSGWPLQDINPKMPETVVFGGKRSFNFRVDVALYNENRKNLGSSSIIMNTGIMNFSPGDRRINAPGSVAEIVSFSNVKAEDLTPILNIVIISVNGIPSKNLIDSGYMRVETGNLKERVTQSENKAVETKKVRTAIKSNAEKTFLGIGGYYKWANNGHTGYGVEVNASMSFWPYTSVGAELRAGTFGEVPPGEDEKKKTTLSVAPTFGFVVPINNATRIFADGGLEMGMLGYGLDGLLVSWATPCIDAGMLYKARVWQLLVKYRLTWYKNVLAHTPSISLFYRF